MKRLHDQSYPAQPEAVAAARHAVRRLLVDERLPARLVSRVELALSEAATNCVLHAYPERDDGTFRVTLELNDRVSITVADNGPGLAPRPNSPGMGLGLPIIGQMSDGMTISDGHGSGTVVLMTFAPRSEETSG